MAQLLNNSTGNFTAAGTWSLVDPTSYSNSETAATATTVAFVSSSSFIPGAITIDGIAIKVSARTAGGGTFSLRLFNVTAAAAVAGTTVTINVADIPSVSPNGWVFMKFAAPVLLLIAPTAYAVQVTSSIAGTVTLYRDGTAGNWSRALRTTTTQAPVAGDDLIISGDFISAGVNNSYTVTMDNTAVTIFGSNVSPTVANGFNSGIQISAKGTLNWGTTAATNYYLKLQGNITLYANGTYKCGTAGTPMPSTSTAKLEFACTSNVQYGFEARINSILTMRGNPITVFAKLNADAAAAATSLTTDVSTGWKNGDVIALAPTTRTATESESKALTADAVTTTLTITALTNAHGGSGQVVAELINLTRNVQVFGTSTVNQSYLNIADVTTDIQYVEFYQLGSATALKRGIDFNPILNTGGIKFCSVHDGIVVSSLGINVSSGTSNNWTIDNCGFYNTQGGAVSIGGTSGTAWTFSNSIAIRCVANSLIAISDMDGTVNNITATGGAANGVAFSDLTFTSSTVSNIIAHSNAGSGISLVNVTALSPISISTFTSWRNNANGIIVNNIFDVIFNTVTAFGNLTANVNSSGHHAVIRWINMTLNGGTTLVCPVGYNTGADQSKIFVDNSTFGSTTAHTTGDVVGITNTFTDLTFRNCLLSSANKVISTNLLVNGAEVRFARFQQTAGNHITYKPYGTSQIDTVIFHNASPSVKMTPNIASQKLEGGVKKVALNNGGTCLISVWVRKSVVGDGANYNGNQPRLILKADPAVGITNDTVLATCVSVNGTWELLSAVTPAITDNAVFQFVVDCDGTIGFINTDDWGAN